MFERFLNTSSKGNQLVFCSVIIFVFHLIFKMTFLDYSGFWYDETFGLYYSLQDWGLIKHTSEWDINAPLYYYFLWIWRNLFGISEYAIRFSSVLFSSLAAVMLFVLSIKYTNRTTAFLSLLLFTVSNEMFFFAHEARVYSIVLFLALCSTYFYFNLLNKKSAASIIFLGIVNFLLIYAHYLTGFILVFQVLILILFFNKSFFKQISIAYAITILLCLWRFTQKTFLHILNNQKSFKEWVAVPTLADLKNTFGEFLNGNDLLYFYLILLSGTLIYLLASKQIKFKEKAEKTKMVYLFFVGILPGIICFLVSQVSPFFIKRYFLFSLPFLFLFIGFVISMIPQKTIKYSVITLISAACFIAYFRIDLKTPKEMDYREAMVLVKKLKTESTVVLVENRDLGALFAYYYDKDIFSDFNGLTSRLKENNIYPVSSPQDLSEIDFKKYPNLILTQSFENLNSDNESLLKELSLKYKKRTLITRYKGIKLLFFAN